MNRCRPGGGGCVVRAAYQRRNLSHDGMVYLSPLSFFSLPILVLSSLPIPAVRLSRRLGRCWSVTGCNLLLLLS
ncbi:uncharacterized protein BO66DRAFT_40441 [Aspergillus aculeatinus CBS 121060]|uniref:Uncharacterized protein n=1 Tax=Aspergillus aculeatinus CBS 121060 TaxID=1448322 RepID=A0ACD1HFC8_9EURO|nr:hypothetical protein BO66DRAFT_40441 [Aspergillus aculeatinus CBS 121060]RAH72214.1 hypothetical protein BO66DRAFT_40441 [Aspergillus aculeatinus CBS 121060]